MRGGRAPLAERFWRMVDRAGPVPAACTALGSCWLWTGTTKPDGYGKISGDRRGRQRTLRAHRVSWELHRGPIPDDAYVLHRCDDPRCVNPAHLFLGSPADNARDMVAKGRSLRGDRCPARAHPERLPHGERHKWAKLTAAVVLAARDLRRRGHSYRAIADELGLRYGTVYQVVTGRKWRWLSPSPGATAPERASDHRATPREQGPRGG